MTAFQLSQLGIAIFGPVAFMLVTAESKRNQAIGVAFGLLSNPCWWVMAISTEQWMTLPVHGLYTFAWLKKAYFLWLK